MRLIPLVLVPLLLAGCGFNGTDPDPGQSDSAVPAANAGGGGDPLAANDDRNATQQIPDSEPRPLMQAQVVLDRLGFTPGVVDGKLGLSTENAVRGFQEANGLTQSGKLDEQTTEKLKQWAHIPATRVVTIPADFAAGPFLDVPEEAEDQAKMEALGYESLDEKLAERFHTTIDVLKQLNPGGVPAGMQQASATGGAAASPTPTASPTASPSASPSASGSPGATASAPAKPGPASFFRAGQQIRVPNVGADVVNAGGDSDANWMQTLRMLGVGSDQPKASRVVVSKSKGTLKAYDQADKLVAVYTATMGSENDPLPLGEWKILGVAHNPPFNYNPDLFWDAKTGDEKAKLPPGPNGPVGVVWIDISKEHYGIHGTPEPQTIGRAQSHGCVRLTNWDAARLAQMVSTSTELLFEA
jgi:lipoprotein-anchoring transpeptidase ErfK/SrfK